MNLTPEQVKKLETFICSDCSTEEEENKRATSNGREVSPDLKVCSLSHDVVAYIVLYLALLFLGINGERPC